MKDRRVVVVFVLAILGISRYETFFDHSMTFGLVQMYQVTLMGRMSL